MEHYNRFAGFINGVKILRGLPQRRAREISRCVVFHKTVLSDFYDTLAVEWRAREMVTKIQEANDVDSAVS